MEAEPTKGDNCIAQKDLKRKQRWRREQQLKPKRSRKQDVAVVKRQPVKREGKKIVKEGRESTEENVLLPKNRLLKTA
jgi:hypothetical protein